MPGMTMEMFTEGGMSADFNIIENIGEMGSLLHRKRNRERQIGSR